MNNRQQTFPQVKGSKRESFLGDLDPINISNFHTESYSSKSNLIWHPGSYSFHDGNRTCGADPKKKWTVTLDFYCGGSEVS